MCFILFPNLFSYLPLSSLFLHFSIVCVVGNIWQPSSDECFGLALGYLTVCLIALIPGYYVSALTVDSMGRKITQFVGFVWMAVWCSACSGSYAFLTNPNMPSINNVNVNGTKRSVSASSSVHRVLLYLSYVLTVPSVHVLKQNDR